MSAAERELRTALKKSRRHTKEKPSALNANDTVKPPEVNALSASQARPDGRHSAAEDVTDSASSEARADDHATATSGHISDAADTEREPSAPKGNAAKPPMSRAENERSAPLTPNHRRGRKKKTAADPMAGAAEAATEPVNAETVLADSPIAADVPPPPATIGSTAKAGTRKKKVRVHANGDGRGEYGSEARVEIIKDAVARLKAMPLEDYELCRKPEAARLGIRVGTLDGMVKAAREAAAIAELANRPERECTREDYERGAKRCGYANWRTFKQKVAEARFDKEAKAAREATATRAAAEARANGSPSDEDANSDADDSGANEGDNGEGGGSEAAPPDPPESPDKPPESAGPPPSKDEAQRAKLIEVAVTSRIFYWHDADGNAFATVPVKDRLERYRLRSSRFKLLLRHLYGAAYPNMKATAKAGFPVPGGVSDAAMNEALPTLEALSQSGPVRVPRNRVCRATDGTVWIDLGDHSWIVVAVTADGWRVVEKADVPLLRPNGLRALPVPKHDPNALAKLRGLLNLNPGKRASKAAIKLADDCFKIIVIFMLSVLWPRGPYCILVVNGEQGSAKTTLCRIIRRMTDPNKVPMRSVPRNPDDLLVTAQNSRLLAIDNVSDISPELADVLCGIATGTGKGGRQLYTDADEAIIEACNPILINGIEGLLTRGDVTDRSLSVMLTEIPDDERRDEAEIERLVEEAAPGVLAALIDAVAEAIKALPGLKLPRLPRMADFTRLACAAAPSFGWSADEIFGVIEDNRRLTIEAVIAADVVATAMLDFLDQRPPEPEGWVWVGSASDLLEKLKGSAPEDTIKSRLWPKTSHHLSGRLKRAAPALRRAGFSITTWREDKERHRKIGIKKEAREESKAQSASEASGASAEQHSSALSDSCVASETDASTKPASGSAVIPNQQRARGNGGDAAPDAGMDAEVRPPSIESNQQQPDNIEQSSYEDGTDAPDAGSYPTLASDGGNHADDDEEGEL
jgi:hypothetical protein